MERVIFSILLLLRAKLSFHIVFGHFNLIFTNFKLNANILYINTFSFILHKIFKGIQLDILRYLLYTTEKLNYNQSDQQAIKTVFTAKCYVAMTSKWYYPTIPQTFMYDDNYMVKIIVVLIEH